MQLINLIIYTPTQQVMDIYPAGTLFLSEDVENGRDWYAHGSSFDDDKLKIQVDGDDFIVCVASDISTLNPVDCSVFEVDFLTLPDNFELSQRWKFIDNNFVLDVDIVELKKQKNAEIENAYNAIRQAGFESSSLGLVHTYRGDERGQSELNSIVLANIAIDYRCTDAAGVKERRHHSAAQIQQVFSDGVIILRDINDTEENLYAAVEAAVDADSVNAIFVGF